MPRVTMVFTPQSAISAAGATTDSTSASVEAQLPVVTIEQLHEELAAVGLPVASAESGPTPKFGEETSALLKVFQQRHKLPVTGNLDPETGATLTLAATVASEGDRSKLRADLQNAVNAVPNSQEYNYWLARYALMAGDYALAARVRPSTFADLIGNDLGNAVFTSGNGRAQPQQPDVTFPENFYSFRYSLMAQEDIDALRLAAAPSPAAQAYMIARRPGNGSPDTFDPPHRPDIYDPPPVAPAGATRQQLLIDSAFAWLSAIEAWQFGNAEFSRQRYASAADAYDRCQNAILGYFASFPDYSIRFTASTLDARVDELLWILASNTQNWADIWGEISWRRSLLSLAELSQFDWMQITPGNIVYQLLQSNLAGGDQPQGTIIGPQHRKVLMDTHLVIIAALLAPLARGEANRLRRQYASALGDFLRVLRNSVPVPNSIGLQVPALLKCEFIEVPFIRLLALETMLDEAEAQYKSRLSVDDELDETKKSAELAQLSELAQEFSTRQIPGDSAGNSTRPFQHLVAAVTYSGALDAVGVDGDYVANTKQALNTLQSEVTSTVADGDVSSKSFRSIGQASTIPTVAPVANDLPGLTTSAYPHETYLQFDIQAGQATQPSNPRVYALLLQAQSRLLQIWNGFNYLGYRDDYVSPWRFSYLLDRARYFAEHAKNAQRDYINFLNNAENEAFKEMSASQNVELEKANVAIETARVDQATEEVAASQQSVKLADLNASDSHQRAGAYQEFSQYADDMFDTHGGGDLVGDLASLLDNVPGLNAALSGLGDVFSGGFVSSRKNALLAHAQRGIELLNLTLAAKEADQARSVAQAQLEVTKAGLVVAGMQRQAALLRHEFALQNLQFMRGQILNTEQWYRMANAIRNVGDIYLRYAIQTAFLAQQAYNFEADKRVNIIRFDYDLSDVGAMLAADFLLRDLDTLEQDLVTSQQTRLQQVRYVVSFAREFPETLRALADVGEAMFNIRLEDLETRFPGLASLRISSVELQPVALMDPTRVSAELAHLGTGLIRLKAQPGTSPLNSTDLAAGADWLPDAATAWPVKIHVSSPQTAVFSGLSRQDATSLSSIAASEHGAFEGLPGASGWRIDMSMKENQVVPGTLADVLITFVLSGYYDNELKAAVTAASSSPRQLATTSFISARNTLPDAYYSLIHDGRLDWKVSDRMLSLTGTPHELRNLAVVLPLVQGAVELGRSYCRYAVQIEISPGAVNVLTILPQFTTTPNGLMLNCAFSGADGTEVSWDFGDGTPPEQGATIQHAYTGPGRYEVLTRLVKDNRLFEYRSAVVVSANHPLIAPLAVTPVFSASPVAADGTVTLTVTTPPGISDVTLDCSAGAVRGRSDSGPATLNLAPGSYLLDFLATRKLSARFYSRQRYLPTDPVDLYRGRVATNRTFDLETGAETTASLDAFGTQLFKEGAATFTLSPVDRWTLELPVADNPWFTTVTSSDVAEFDCSELADAILGLEFVTPQ
jgi:peptidoglycan hydrolase-like protein with peptidoglycan-binding domain